MTESEFISKNSVAETSSIKSLFWISFLTVGLYFSGFLEMFTPLPLIFYFLKFPKQNPLKGILPALGTVILFYALALSPLHALYQSHPNLEFLLPLPWMGLLSHFDANIVRLVGIGYFLLFLGIGFSSSRVLNSQKEDSLKLILRGIILATFLVLAILVLLEASTKTNLVEAYQSQIKEMIHVFLKAQEQEGLGIDEVLQIEMALDEYASQSIKLIPFVVLLSVSFLMILNLFAGRWIYVVVNKSPSPFQLREIKVPFWIVWFFIFSGFSLILNKLTLNSENLHYIGLNLFLGLLLLYFFIGLAVVLHYLDRKMIYGLPRLLFLFLLLMFHQPVILIFTFLGIADQWKDFRKLSIDQNTTNTPPAVSS